VKELVINVDVLIPCDIIFTEEILLTKICNVLIVEPVDLLVSPISDDKEDTAICRVEKFDAATVDTAFILLSTYPTKPLFASMK
jgi:hypothetical protein